MDINFVIFVFRKLFTTILTSGATKRHTTLPGEGLGLIHKRPSCQLIGRQPSPCKICLGMKIGHQLRFFTINKSASSLYSLIVYGQYRATSLGRNKRKTLIGSQASLQNNVTRKGSMLSAAINQILKQELVSPVMRSTIVSGVTPGSGLAQGKPPITAIHVGMRLLIHQTMETSTSRPWVTSWFSNKS